MKELLPATRNVADEVYVCQQDDEPAYRARQTVDCFVGRETADFFVAKQSGH